MMEFYSYNDFRRRALMEKADVILSPIHNPEMLAVCYSNNLCGEHYMLAREAAQKTSVPSQLFRYKDNIVSLEEMRFFTKLTAASGTCVGYARGCKIVLCPPNWTSISADALRRLNSLELCVIGKKVTSIGARNIYQLTGSPGSSVTTNRVTWVLLNPDSVVTLNSNNTNSAAAMKAFYVPDDLVNSYKAASVWSANYASKIFGLSDLPSEYRKYVNYYN